MTSLARVEVRLLLEQADGEAGGEPGLAGEAVVEAGHDLAAATTCPTPLAPEHADLGARVEGRG